MCSRVWDFIKSRYKTLPDMGNFMKFHHGYSISYGKLVIPIMGMMHALIPTLGFKSHIHGLCFLLWVLNYYVYGNKLHCDFHHGF